MRNFKKYTRPIAGLLVLVAIIFVLVNHGRFWGGVLSDTMTQEERERAAVAFDFDDYYTYGAMLSDFKRLLQNGTKKDFKGTDKDFIDKILTRQKAFINIRAHDKPLTLKNGDYMYPYNYSFRKLDRYFLPDLICEFPGSNGFEMRYDKNNNFLAFIFSSGCWRATFSLEGTQK